MGERVPVPAGQRVESNIVSGGNPQEAPGDVLEAFQEEVGLQGQRVFERVQSRDRRRENLQALLGLERAQRLVRVAATLGPSICPNLRLPEPGNPSDLGRLLLSSLPPRKSETGSSSVGIFAEITPPTREAIRQLFIDAFFYALSDPSKAKRKVNEAFSAMFMLSRLYEEVILEERGESRNESTPAESGHPDGSSGGRRESKNDLFGSLNQASEEEIVRAVSLLFGPGSLKVWDKLGFLRPETEELLSDILEGAVGNLNAVMSVLDVVSRTPIPFADFLNGCLLTESGVRRVNLRVMLQAFQRRLKQEVRDGDGLIKGLQAELEEFLKELEEEEPPQKKTFWLWNPEAIAEIEARNPQDKLYQLWREALASFSPGQGVAMVFNSLTPLGIVSRILNFMTQDVQTERYAQAPQTIPSSLRGALLRHLEKILSFQRNPFPFLSSLPAEAWNNWPDFFNALNTRLQQLGWENVFGPSLEYDLPHYLFAYFLFAVAPEGKIDDPASSNWAVQAESLPELFRLLWLNYCRGEGHYFPHPAPEMEKTPSRLRALEREVVAILGDSPVLQRIYPYVNCFLAGIELPRILVLMGPSGGGKTYTARVIADILANNPIFPSVVAVNFDASLLVPEGFKGSHLSDVFLLAASQVAEKYRISLSAAIEMINLGKVSIVVVLDEFDKSFLRKVGQGRETFSPEEIWSPLLTMGDPSRRARYVQVVSQQNDGMPQQYFVNPNHTLFFLTGTFAPLVPALAAKRRYFATYYPSEGGTDLPPSSVSSGDYYPSEMGSGWLFSPDGTLGELARRTGVFSLNSPPPEELVKAWFGRTNFGKSFVEGAIRRLLVYNMGNLEFAEAKNVWPPDMPKIIGDVANQLVRLGYPGMVAFADQLVLAVERRLADDDRERKIPLINKEMIDAALKDTQQKFPPTF